MTMARQIKIPIRSSPGVPLALPVPVPVQRWQSQWHTTIGRRRPSGFSLLELMIVVSVIGILTAMAAPSYLNAVRQSRADIAGANMRAIWAAERLYWLEYHGYTDKLAPQTAPDVGLADMGLLDSALFASGNYTYSIASFSDTAFSATAASPDNDITITIDQNGNVQATGIKLGFQ
jgi:prepilin-type N-terminal cleavage/methylation domain-containing protein